MNPAPRTWLPGIPAAWMLLAAMLPAPPALQARPQEEPASSSSHPEGDPEKGKELFHAIGCWQCHGYSAQGGRAGPPLVPDPRPFPAFAEYVRAPKGEMPPYTRKVLSDAGLADIHAFLEAIPRPREVQDIPLLNPKEN